MAQSEPLCSLRCAICFLPGFDVFKSFNFHGLVRFVYSLNIIGSVKGAGSPDYPNPKIVFRALWTSFRYVLSILPILLSSLLLSITLICSHSSTESSFKPPVPAGIFTCDGKMASLILVVNGIMMVCGLFKLALSIWMTKAGRIPDCSVPTTGFKSTRNTSPRFISREFPL